MVQRVRPRAARWSSSRRACPTPSASRTGSSGANTAVRVPADGGRPPELRVDDGPGLRRQAVPQRQPLPEAAVQPKAAVEFAALCQQDRAAPGPSWTPRSGSSGCAGQWLTVPAAGPVGPADPQLLGHVPTATRRWPWPDAGRQDPLKRRWASLVRQGPARRPTPPAQDPPRRHAPVRRAALRRCGPAGELQVRLRLRRRHDGEIQTIPACMWPPYRNVVLKKVAEKYGAVDFKGRPKVKPECRRPWRRAPGKPLRRAQGRRARPPRPRIRARCRRADLHDNTRVLAPRLVLSGCFLFSIQLGTVTY